MANADQSQDFDLIVVGCGIAGLSAAVTAQQNGARVAVIERAIKDERGGNTRYTESYWRMRSCDAAPSPAGWRHSTSPAGIIAPLSIFNRSRP